MASLQAAASAEVYYEENKAVVTEMMKAAETLLTVGGEIKFGAQTAGQIKNSTHWPLLYFDKKDWAGEVQKPYPFGIGSTGTAEFVHASHMGVGQADSGAVVYITNKSNYGWLLAWSVPAPSPHAGPNKVYVEAGPVEHLIKWDHIKARLEASGSTCLFVDPHKGAQMFAKIDPHANFAKLAAIYSQKL